MCRSLDLSIVAVLLGASALSADSVPVATGAPAGYGLEVYQVAVLHNGFTIDHVRHEVVGRVTRLWLAADSAGSYLEIPSEQIDSFEQGQRAVLLPPAAPEIVKETTAAIVVPSIKDQFKTLIDGAASRYQIDPDFVSSVVKAESGFNPAAVSPKGAQGLMQLMPRTAATLGVKDALDPAANVEGGTKYLRQLLDQYGGDAVKALAAYNAGPRRVEQYRGIPPYPETRAYVARIIDDYNRKKLNQQTNSDATPATK